MTQLPEKLREIEEELRYMPMSPYGRVLNKFLLDAAAEIERLRSNGTDGGAKWAALKRSDDLLAELGIAAENHVRQANLRALSGEAAV